MSSCSALTGRCDEVYKSTQSGGAGKVCRACRYRMHPVQCFELGSRFRTPDISPCTCMRARAHTHTHTHTHHRCLPMSLPGLRQPTLRRNSLGRQSLQCESARRRNLLLPLPPIQTESHRRLPRTSTSSELITRQTSSSLLWVFGPRHTRRAARIWDICLGH